MSRRGNSKTAASVQFFPFLAVLICTIGALVVLLVVMSRQARSSAIAAAHNQVQAVQVDQETAAAERELAELRVAQLKEARDKTAAQLDEQRLKLSHLEDHLRRLREQSAGLKASVDELERLGSASDQQRGAAAAELAELKTRIAEAKRELTTAEANAQNRQVSYSVIPYEGPNQTRRRPIYIECQLDSVIIQPEGITLYASDFEGPLGPGNPLAAALRAIREQVATQEAAAGAEKSEPYPLLLVRPDGIVAYYAARSALASWGSEFGYEMVEQDWNLEFPPADPRLTEATRVALAEARERQKQLAAAAPRHFPKNSKPTFHARPRGGFEQQGGPRGKNARGGDSPWERSLAAGRGSRARPGNGGNGIDETGDSENGSSETSIFGGPGNAGGNESGGGSSGSESGTLAGGSFQPGPAGQAGTAGGGTAGSQGTAVRGVGSQGSAATGSDGNPSGVAGSGQPGKAMQPGGPTQNGTNTKGSQQSAGGGNQLPNPADVAMLRSTQPGGPQGSGGSASSSGQRNGSAQGGGTTASGGTAASGDANSSGPGGASGQPGGGQEASDTPAATAQLNKKKPASLAQARGSDWGLPNAGNGSTAVTRPIVVECRPDRLIILPESGTGGGKTVPIVGATQDSVDDLVSGVWQHMKSWGIAGRGLYWKPTLVMVVSPGAERRYAELESLLNDSGLEVKQRAAKPPVANNSKTKQRK